MNTPSNVKPTDNTAGQSKSTETNQKHGEAKSSTSGTVAPTSENKK